MARPTLSDLTAFAAVARRRSFVRAASDLEQSPSSLSHAIRALETRLGVRLFNRSTRSVALSHVHARPRQPFRRLRHLHQVLPGDGGRR